MAIGLAPLFPLNRVQTNPEARFQRFGINDSQLFGKPMVQVAASESRPVQPPRENPRPPTNPPLTQDLAESRPKAGLNPQTTNLESSLTYSAGLGTKSVLGVSPKPGSQLDVKA